MRAIDADADHVKQRAEWFLHGRIVPGKSAAELRHRAYRTKMQARISRFSTAHGRVNSDSHAGTGWTPLGPVPLASNASGTGFQDYHQVSGRATAVAIDPADPSGNTVYIGGAQGGVWKSINAADVAANSVLWTALTDDEATLSTGSIAIQPGNSVPGNSLILVGTGEPDNSADSYFGLGIVRSTNAGSTWTLISNANAGTLSFSGLGAAALAFSTASPNTVVAAMAVTNEGTADGSVSSSTEPGLYTSTDAGQTWNYDAIFSGGAAEATSATSAVYNSGAGLFFAALRYHGFYSSPDGVTWTRLANQPGTPGLLGTTACPANYSTSCPIFRGEITAVPGRNEMYVWFVSQDTDNNPLDQGIWQSLNGGSSWTQISDSGIVNCGDFNGCGVDQGFYNLELLALPNGSAATDLYAGAINLYKCTLTSINPTCAISSAPFINLTHVYGCDPLGAPAHVHPDQHALAYTIPTSGADTGASLMFFANDGGIYRALNAFTGLATGLCSSTNQFDDLNQNLGSMTQFVAFSQNTANANTLLGGTQDNGSPATATATSTDTGWGNVLSGDGGYNAIDSVTGNWFASNPDPGSGNLNIQQCSAGVNCNNGSFSIVVSSSNLAGDDGGFYFPYILDPQSATAMLVGTCRVWSGPRTGGTFTALSLNFDTLGLGTCSGTEVNVVRSLAGGGIANPPTHSPVIYATTDGPGPNNLSSPVGGNVWVTTEAASVSGTVSTFANVTLNGPGGGSINPNQFPISAVAIDSSDTSGQTAYVTLMGFTGGPGHVWQTTNAGASWSDFSGVGANAIPDSPANTVIVDSTTHTIYVGTDVGVFASATAAAAWSEVGGSSAGFLPNVAVTDLAIFNSPCQKLLRASTYGRGVWQFALALTGTTPDFCLTESTPFPVVNVGSTTTSAPVNVIAINGFAGTVALSCSIPTGGSCTATPASVQSFPATVSVTVNATSLAAGNNQFNLQGVSGSLTSSLAAAFEVADFQLSGTASANINPGGQGAANISITPSTFYGGSVIGSCNVGIIPGATCTVFPVNPIAVNLGATVPVAVTINVPGNTGSGIYNVSFAAHDTSGFPSHTFTTAITVPAAAGSDFQLASTKSFPATVDAAAQTTAKITVMPNYSGTVTATCDATALSGQCSITPANPVPITAGVARSLSTLVNVPNSAAPKPSNFYTINVTVADASGRPSHILALPLTVIQDFAIGTVSPASQTISAGQSASYNFSVFPVASTFSGTVSLSCSDGPAISLCSFSPAAVTPGSNSAAVVMTITTTSSSAKLSPLELGRPFVYAFALIFPGLALLRRKTRVTLFSPTVFLLLFLLSSCGGGGSNGGGSGGGGGGGGQQQGTQPGTYAISVSGNSGTLSHSAASTASLIVSAP